MNENIENVLATLDSFRTNDEMTYSAYSTLHDEISLLDDLLKEQEPQSVVESSNMYTGLSITHCPKCGFALDRFLYGREYLGEIKHCPMCGKAVKWDE